MSQKKLEIMNLVDTRLVDLAEKGTLGYIEELYNPLNFFDVVHHIAYWHGDRNIKLRNPTIRTHILRVPLHHLNFIEEIVIAPFALIQLFQIAKKNKVCLIRGRYPYHGSLAGLVLSKLLKIPFVVSIGGVHRLVTKLRGRYPVLNSKFLTEKEEEIVLKGADKVICPNQCSKDYAISIGVSPEKTAIVPLRLKNDIFNFTYQDSDILVSRGIDRGKRIILYIGRFAADKQIDVLIEAIPLVTRDYPEACFVLIGDGKLKAKMQQRVIELGQEQTVYFLGFQPTEIIKYCLSVATLVCVPISGFVILEAAAASKAIVAFDVEWHSEFIKDGQTGVLVENRNHVKLAEAIRRLLADPRLANLLGRNARNLIETEYDPQRAGEREIAVLLEVMREKGSALKAVET